MEGEVRGWSDRSAGVEGRQDRADREAGDDWAGGGHPADSGPDRDQCRRRGRGDPESGGAGQGGAAGTDGRQLHRLQGLRRGRADRSGQRRPQLPAKRQGAQTLALQRSRRGDRAIHQTAGRDSYRGGKGRLGGTGVDAGQAGDHDEEGGTAARGRLESSPKFPVVYSQGQAPARAGILCYAEVLMSGHSKWATIKHKKGALDAKRGKIFTRIIKEISIAAKGGGDPDGNPRLRTAILAAKAENMPQENIKRAIQRGTGELEGVNYEEVTFEGYGPGGVAIILEVLTDNRNRAVSEIRHAFTKNGGNLGESGSVRFMFHKKGLIAVEKSAATEEKLMDIVLENGGEDLNDEGDTWEIVSDPADYERLAAAIKAAGIPTVMSEVTMVASTYTKLEGSAASQMIRLLEALEELDDTQNVYSNFDMDAEQMEAAAR